MTAVNDAIVTQTAAKIACDLVASVKHETVKDALDSWEEAFTIVNDSVFGKIGRGSRTPSPVGGGREVPVIKGRDDIMSGIERVQQGRPVSSMKSNAVPQVSVKGKVTGDIPQWLHRAAAKAGVTEVWDNRDSLKENPKRPHFVSTDENKTPFWAPKGLTTDDLPF